MRFEAGRIKASDAIKMLGAGLRGAGYEIDDTAVASMRVEGGAAGVVDIIARLLAVTFTALIDGRDGPGSAKFEACGNARQEGRWGGQRRSGNTLLSKPGCARDRSCGIH